MVKPELNIMVNNLVKHIIWLVKGHYFINAYTELTSYCLEHYEEVKDIKYCNTICNRFKYKYERVMIYL